MRKGILITAFIAVLTIGVNVQATAKIDGTEEIYITAYTSSKDAITASGQTVREGIAAGADKYLYDRADGGSWVALVYTTDGDFIGFYELLDRGGTEAIRDGRVLDIWMPDIDKCKDLMEETDGKCLVKYVKAYG